MINIKQYIFDKKRELIVGTLVAVLLVGTTFLDGKLQNKSEMYHLKTAALALAEQTRQLENFGEAYRTNLCKYPVIKASEIYVDDQLICTHTSLARAQSVIYALKQPKLNDGQTLIEASFLEDVTILTKRASLFEIGEFMTVDQAIAYIKTSGEQIVYHTVAKGDTLSEVAEQYDISTDRLVADNLELSQKKYLSIGDKLVIKGPQSLITSTYTVEESAIKKIAPSEMAIKTNDLYTGEKKLKQKGTEGEVHIVEKVSFVSDRVVKRTEIFSEVLKEKTDDVYYVGTKRRPVTQVANNLSRPCTSYRVSSRFGTRSLGFHTGIDLTMPVGSPVHVAEDGVVIFSGSKGTYGLFVMIDHGGGLVTCYAHNSKLWVSKGDTVAKGQKIASSGNTGRTTGPHLHFEVRVNGTAVNPEKYLSF